MKERLKKVIPLLMVFTMVFAPFMSLKGHAYNGGLLEGKSLNYGSTISETINSYTQLTDNNLGTFVDMQGGKRMWYSFSEPTNLSGFYVNTLQPNDVAVEFYDSNKTLITSKSDRTGVGLAGQFDFAVSSVSYVAIVNTYQYSNRVYEFDVYGNSINHTEISNLITSVNSNSVTLTYDIPSSNTHFIGSKIYRNGDLISTQNSLSGSFTDTGLAFNQSYSYKVTALYDDDFETNGIIGTAVLGSAPVDPSTVPPNPVLGLTNSNVTDKTVELSWSNPSDLDLNKVRIYKNDILLSEVDLTNVYTVSGLTPSTQYKLSVSLVDNDGNEGQKSEINVTTLEGLDNIPPTVVSGVSVTSGDGALFVQWDENTMDDDIAGYNVYLNGVKFNSILIKNGFVTIPDLENGLTYDIQVSSVDKTGNESSLSTAKTGKPEAGLMPIVKTKYNLSDVAQGVSEWFKSYWLIIAFASAIPLSFYIASRIKLMFID